MTGGYVDAVGFMMTGGFFVSFMSGNSTRLAVGLIDGAAYAAEALGLIAAFVAGASIGALVGRMAKDRRGLAVLILVSLLLAAAATLSSFDADRLAIMLLALAMAAPRISVLMSSSKICSVWKDGVARIT